MFRIEHQKADFESYKKAWHVDLIDSDINEINDLITSNPLLNQTLFLQDSALAVKDIRRMSYSCILGNVEKVLGWPTKVFFEEGVSFYVSNIPEKEFWGLGEITRLINEYVVTLTDEEMKSFRAVFDYKMKREDGSVSRICQESIVLKRDVNGNILFFLAVVSDITNLKREGKQHLHLCRDTENVLYEIDNLHRKIEKVEILSTRELEIAKLIGQFMSSEQIGEKLFISKNTVDKHRQNMLQKLSMENTAELINFLRVYRFI